MQLRSLLFVPGDRPDQMRKAPASGADALILDLEDAVAAPRKAQARHDIAAFLSAPRAVSVLVRINALQAGCATEDLAALAASVPDAVVLPKAEGAASIVELERLMDERSMRRVPILPIATETPAALFRLGEYSGVNERLLGITWGAEDLSAAVGAAASREADGTFAAPYEIARALTLFAAHAAGVPAIETVYPEFRDLDGLARYASRGARDGFTGMLAIHPSQVRVINAAFTPSPQMVERARRIVAAFAANPGAGVLSLDGAMVDTPHLKQAQGVLARADAATSEKHRPVLG